MRIKNQYMDLIIIIAFTVLCMIILNITSLTENDWLNIILIIPILFLFTGYGIITILFPLNNDLNPIIRLILSIVISIAIIPEYGYILRYDPFKIFINHFILFTGTLTLILSVLALLTRYRKIKHIKKDEIEGPDPLHIYRIRTSYRDLFVAGLLTLFSLSFVYLNLGMVNQIFYIFLSLILPGYSLMTVLFWDIRDLGIIKKSILSLSLSILLVLSLGVLSELVYTISPKNTFLILAILIMVFLLLAGLRRRKKLKEEEDDLREFKKSDKEEKILIRKIRKDSDNKVQLEDFKHKNRDLDIILSLIFLATIFSGTSPLSGTVLQNLFMIPLILFLPGYTLLTVIFPQAMVSHRRWLNIVKFLLAGIILSLLITLSIGVIVFIAPCPFSPLLCTGLIIIITAVLLVLAYFRRRRLSRMKFIKSEITRKRDDKDRLRQLEKYEKPIKDSVEAEAPEEISKFDKRIRKPLTGRFKFLSNDLFLISLLTVLTIIFVTVPVLNETVVRTVLGLMFILFIPGYSLIAALFPRKQDLDGIERLALSFGLSIAITPLIGLILNYTPFGIRLDPILITLSLVTFLLIATAFLRRRRIPEDERFHLNLGVHFQHLKSSFNQESRLDKILSVILIISIILAISATIYIIVTPKEGEKFTEFYILGSGGKASDYPTNLTVGQSGKLIVGVVNHEYSNVTYNLLVRFNGTPVTSRNITLAHEKKWEQLITFNATNPGANQKLELLLYKLPDKQKPYRSLHLWVDVT
ncbi:MAG: DUF1616 domain-containing protein [Methanobacteriaceae archaeon]|nr:DUF1616 domain-containing protein [Methanobacteriaceae archaeon]